MEKGLLGTPPHGWQQQGNPMGGSALYSLSSSALHSYSRAPRQQSPPPPWLKKIFTRSKNVGENAHTHRTLGAYQM